MKLSDMHPSLRVALFNYGMVFAVMIVLGALRAFVGDPTSLVALKLLVVPLWWLSIGGLDAIYLQPIVEPRWTLRAVEHTLLGALLFVAFMTVTIWTPEIELSKLLLAAGVMAALMSTFRLWELRDRIRSLQGPTSS